MQADQVFPWIFSNYLEIIGTITGLFYLYFQVRGHILLWFFGIISSGIYVYVFFEAQIYADMGINIYYFVLSIYGWFHWAEKKSKQKEGLPITSLKFPLLMKVLGVNILLFALIYFILENYTDTNVALVDAFTTSSSIVATWMLTQKILEHWIFWIIIDAVSAGLYIYKELFPTVLLFSVYTVVSIIGYYNWKRNWITQKK